MFLTYLYAKLGYMDVVSYKGKEYYFVSDIQTNTGIPRAYIYRLIKKKTILSLEKEGIRLIDKSSFDEYFLKREIKPEKAEILRKLKEADPDQLKEIRKILDI